MKKIIALLGWVALLASSFSFAQSNSEVHNWLYQNGLTRYDNINDFRAGDWITRGEMSKFVTKYAEFRGLSKNYDQCNFNDIAGYDSTLEPFIIEACEYGLLKGSGNTYNPTGSVTESQAITVTVRSLIGWFFDETWAYRRQAYYQAGQVLWIIQNETLQWVDGINITRIKMGKRFYQAAGVSDAEIRSLDWEEGMRNILFEIFGDIDL